jgi:hypothetical protein
MEITLHKILKSSWHVLLAKSASRPSNTFLFTSPIISSKKKVFTHINKKFPGALITSCSTDREITPFEELALSELHNQIMTVTNLTGEV